MTNRKTTKRALISSLLALLVCCTMLIGTTFAWFTDGEFIKGNVIKAGTLDIELGSDTKLFSVSELWEPGYSEAAATTLKNVGSLALKYSFSIANLQYEGNANIAEVLDVYAGVYTGAVDANGSSVIDGTLLGTLAELNEMDNFGITDDGVLLPGEETPVKLVIKMQESAGNEYQAAQCSFDINILATQVPYEVDGNNNPNYDQEATFGTAVATEADLAAALGAGKNVTVTAPIAIDAPITVTGDVTIDLQAGLDTSAIQGSRPFILEEGSNLTINAGDETVTYGGWGLVKVPNGGSVTINDGIFTGATDNGALVRVSGTNTDDVVVTLNNVKYTDTAAEGYVVSTDGQQGNVKVIVNGGTFTANAGIVLSPGVDLHMNKAKLNTKGLAVEIGGGKAYIDGCTITVDPGVTVSTAPAAIIAASYNGYVQVTNSTLTGKNATIAYAVYPTGGDIEAANNTVNVADDANIYKIWDNAGTIAIDGLVYGD